MKNSEKIESHILNKYEIVKKLGSGAYGHVWKAKRRSDGSVVALKKIFDAFQHSTDAQRTFREISILHQLKHDKIINLIDVICSHNNQDIYLVFGFMESDLYHMIYEAKLQPVHIKYLMYQIVLGLHYLHECKLIHRDLKPSNILINSDCSIKICDFGLVRYLENAVIDVNMLTEGVATRWYRAPEVLLGSNSYGVKADIWSLGCILAEILLKNPLFPGNCTTNQLQRILQFTGQPSTFDIKSLETQLGEIMISQICNIRQKKKVDFFQKIEDQNMINLVYWMLEFNPNKRPSTFQILQHPYFSQFFSQSDLIVKKTPIFMQVSENMKLQSSEYLAIIKQKFDTNNVSKSRVKRRISESPKSFSDLRKSRLKSQQTSDKKIQQTSVSKKNKCTNLFKELCKQKSMSRDRIVRKKSNEKQNDNGNKVQNLGHKAELGLSRFRENKQISGFSGLRKISKFNKL